jgi:hypothetical protein
MDARTVVEAAEMSLVAVQVKVTTVIKVDDLVLALRSLFDPATVLAPLLALGSTSRSAVAPDYIPRGGQSALAMA